MSTQQSAAEQVADALSALTDAAVAAIHGVIDLPIIDAVHAARDALERWREERSDRREPTAAEIDQHLDNVLRASGSKLGNYTMASSLDAMRAAMREAMLDSKGGAAA